MTSLHAPRTVRQEWTAAMQATLVVCSVCLLVAWLAPSTRPWVPLVLAVLWFRGPIGVLLPVGLEPVLMQYGAHHSTLAVVSIAAAASAATEAISIRVMRGVASLEALSRTRQSLRAGRVVRLFERQPAAAVAFGALSPVPDWFIRSLAAVSGYHPVRYVLADTVGRLPKLWIPVAAGGLITIDASLMRGFLLSQFVLVGTVAGLRWYRARSGAQPSEVACPSTASVPSSRSSLVHS
ncbi:MAG: hypothetical protein ACJ8B6_10815 [Gemmatimonadales bacterium]